MFLDKNHLDNINKLNKLWLNLCELSEFAKSFGIYDIFQDNGAKTLQQLLYLNLHNLQGREGNDAVDANGEQWELKSINIKTTSSGFSTNHHLNHDILKKYRQVYWSFAIYDGINLKEIYVLRPSQLEVYFKRWEDKLNKGQAHLNNPKIPIKFIQESGLLVYPIDYNEPKNPNSIYL